MRSADETFCCGGGLEPSGEQECIAEIAQRLADLGALRTEIDAGYAADVLWLYFGYSSLYVLHHENGWPYERAELWLATQAARELLPEL